MNPTPASKLFACLAIALLFAMANVTFYVPHSGFSGDIIYATIFTAVGKFLPGTSLCDTDRGSVLFWSNVYALVLASILFCLTLMWRRFRCGWIGLVLLSVPAVLLTIGLCYVRDVMFHMHGYQAAILLPALVGVFTLSCLAAALLQIVERYDLRTGVRRGFRAVAWGGWVAGSIALGLYAGTWVMSSEVRLVEAVNGSDNVAVRQELTRNPDTIRTMTNEYRKRYLLTTAIERQDLELARLLLYHGCPVSGLGYSYSHSPMHLAAKSGSMAMFRLLMEKGGDIRAVTEDGYTTLHLASGSPEIAAFLIAHGLDVHAKTKEGATPLHRAAGNRGPLTGSLKVAELLIARGADVNAQKRNIMKGDTPLHAAATPQMVSLLLRHGAEINAKNEYGSTPLRNCVGWQQYAAAKALVLAGADVNSPASWPANQGTPLTALRADSRNSRQKSELEALLLARGAKEHYAKLRILTYNIHHGAGMDRKLDLPRIAELIKGQQPDLVALQEVEKGSSRTKKVDQAAELAKGAEFKNWYFGKAFDFAGGGFGNAVLINGEAYSVRMFTKPLPPSGEPRGVIQASYTNNYPGLGTPITFLATHLDWEHADGRKKQVEAILEYAAKLPADAPVILAGDFNAEPGDAALAPLRAAGWIDATASVGPTFPADVPKEKIDYVWVRPGKFKLKVLESKVIEEKVASDHRPVLSVIELSL